MPLLLRSRSAPCQTADGSSSKDVHLTMFVQPLVSHRMLYDRLTSLEVHFSIGLDTISAVPQGAVLLSHPTCALRRTGPVTYVCVLIHPVWHLRKRRRSTCAPLRCTCCALQENDSWGHSSLHHRIITHTWHGLTLVRARLVAHH